MSAVSRVDTSPLTIGAVTTDRMAAAIVSSVTRSGMPAAFSGLAASASASENGAVAAATADSSERR
jgi:hypothetical protein